MCGAGARATLANFVTHVDCAFGEDLRAQSAAMREPSNHIAPGQPLQVLAGLAQTNAANLDVTNLELAAYKVIERHTASNHVSACLTRSQFKVVFLFEGLNRFGLDQRKLAIG